jgi:small subunit ribosomal protein S6
MEERLYDLVFICMPATPEEEINKLIATLEEAVGKHGAKVEKVEKWGTRKMAYRVAKQREGYYVLMVLRGTEGDLIKELERRLRVTDIVIKYMTVRLDEQLKRQQKLVGKRERRARQKPRKTAGATSGAGGGTSGGTTPSPSPGPAAEPAAAAS